MASSAMSKTRKNKLVNSYVRISPDELPILNIQMSFVDSTLHIWPRLFCILKIEKQSPQNRSKNNVLASGTYLDRSRMVDLPGGKLFFSLSSTDRPIQATFHFHHVFTCFLRLACSYFFCLGASHGFAV